MKATALPILDNSAAEGAAADVTEMKAQVRALEVRKEELENLQIAMGRPHGRMEGCCSLTGGTVVSVGVSTRC